MPWRSKVLSAALVALLGTVLCGGFGSTRQAAYAAETWDIQVSGDPAWAITSYAFWPATLAIHAGDTVRWSFFSGVDRHTVTFTPDGAALAKYLPGPVDGEYTFGPAWYPAGPAVPDGIFDAGRVMSSGVIFGVDPPVYSLTFSTEGVFTYACQIHPGMQGTITVLSGSAALTENPMQARQRGLAALDGSVAALQSRITAAATGDERAQEGVAAPRAEEPAVHAVLAGLSDSAGAGALAYFPAALTVRRGDVVRWTNGNDFTEHTITLPSGMRPPDYPAVGRSGVPFLMLEAGVGRPSGEGSYAGQGYLNSGLLQPRASFELTVDAPPGTYQYVCLLHREQMRGTITVTDDSPKQKTRALARFP